MLRLVSVSFHSEPLNENPLDVTTQLVNSLSFLCRRKIASGDGFWNLFWKALADLVQGAVPYFPDPDTAPILFHDALESIQISLEDPTTDIETMFQRGFKSFVKVLAYEMEYNREWTTSETGSAILFSIVRHPIWELAGRRIATLPLEGHTTAAQKCLRTLDRIRQKLQTSSPNGGSADEAQFSSPSRSPEDLRPTSSPDIRIDVQPTHEGDLTAAVVDYSQPEEDEDTTGVGDQMDSDKEQLATTVTSTPVALSTPPTILPPSTRDLPS